MADYVPVRMGDRKTRKASADIVGGKLVHISGVGTVATATAASTKVDGVAATDVKTNDSVTVYSGGEQSVLASGLVTAGDLVIAGASGTVASLAAVTTPTPTDVTNTRAIIGTATTTGTDVPVRVEFR